MTAQKKSSEIPHKLPSLVALRRAVASSTAVETGESIQKLERKLDQRSTQQRFAHVGLAT